MGDDKQLITLINSNFLYWKILSVFFSQRQILLTDPDIQIFKVFLVSF